MKIKEKFEKLKTAEELMEFMNQHIKYGWKGKDNKLRESNIKEIVLQYRMSTLEEILETGYGICFEQVELEKEFFKNRNIKTKTFAIYTNHMCHVFLIYKIRNTYYKFEHSSSKCRGIFEYKTEEELLKAEIESFCERHHIKNKEKIKLITYETIKEYSSIEEIKEEFNKKETIKLEK